MDLAVVYYGFRGGGVLPLYNMGLGGGAGPCRCISRFLGGSEVLPLYIMAIWEGGGVLGLAVVYHCLGGSLVLPLYIMALGGGPGSCHCISGAAWHSG